jgi:hypothetical protein
MAGTISNEIRKYTVLAFEINIMRKFQEIKIVPKLLSRNIQVSELSEALDMLMIPQSTEHQF